MRTIILLTGVLLVLALGMLVVALLVHLKRNNDILREIDEYEKK